MDEHTLKAAVEALQVRISADLPAGAAPYAVLPPNFEVRSLEEQLVNPIRKRGTVTLADADSLAAYVNHHGTDATTIYADVALQVVTAVLNDHRGVDQGGARIAGFGDHRAIYTPAKSPQWETWRKLHGQPMSQAQFAAFIEENLPDIAGPSGNIAGPTAAQMLEVSRNLIAQQGVVFQQATRLQTGDTDLTYTEKTDGHVIGSKGKVKVPPSFWLGIPVFRHDDPYRIEARLRYRIKDGALAMWYELVRPELVVEDAFQRQLDRLRKKTSPERLTLMGSPRTD